MHTEKAKQVEEKKVCPNTIDMIKLNNLRMLTAGIVLCYKVDAISLDGATRLKQLRSLRFLCFSVRSLQDPGRIASLPKYFNH